LIDSKPIRSSQNRQRLIGLVPQDIALYSHMTARENLNAFAKIMGMRGRKNRRKSVAAALASVEMDHKSDALISALSGGMKRRINVAAAIMHSPAVLILDEPTAGVDTPARDTVHRLARKLADDGMAVLLVTHELEQAEALCDKLLVLAGGKTLAFDNPADLLITDKSEDKVVSTFMTSLRGTDTKLREISVRRPGLNHLMHTIEKNGTLPAPLKTSANA